jgi:hypothetical protein
VLTVKSGLDPHMIIKLKDNLNRWFCLFISELWIDSPQIVSLRADINLHLANCGSTNLNYTDSNTQVLSQGLQRTSNGVTPWPVG